MELGLVERRWIPDGHFHLVLIELFLVFRRTLLANPLTKATLEALRLWELIDCSIQCELLESLKSAGKNQLEQRGVKETSNKARGIGQELLF